MSWESLRTISFAGSFEMTVSFADTFEMAVSFVEPFVMVISESGEKVTVRTVGNA